MGKISYAVKKGGWEADSTDSATDRRARGLKRWGWERFNSLSVVYIVEKRKGASKMDGRGGR